MTPQPNEKLYDELCYLKCKTCLRHQFIHEGDPLKLTCEFCDADEFETDDAEIARYYGIEVTK